MKRIASQPRPEWQKTVESQGFHFHTPDGQPYWDESVYYQFTAPQIDALEKATYALNEMCLAAVQEVIDRDNLWDKFQLPPPFAEYLKQSWQHDELSVYGRFDLAYDGVNPPQLLEYNADTPTSLLEAAVIQWYWLQDTHKELDQFNTIHDRLIEAWKAGPGSRRLRQAGVIVHFSSLSGHVEDFMTVNYLRDTAMQAGLSTQYIEVERIGWNEGRRTFVDEQERPIAACFKLYPWEWMIRERFGPQLLANTTYWLESPWKMLLSNKAILPLLHEMYSDSPYILPASFEPVFDSFVRKPLLAREGANIQVVKDGNVVHETGGVYPGPYVYQQLNPLPCIDERYYPLIGSWLVNGYACGIGIREDETPITGNLSRFMPHLFVH
jgi:glutathionylspermidine synthase